MLVLDAGGVSRLAERSAAAVARIDALRREGLWPPRVPSVVLVESLTGQVGPDTPVNRFLKACDVIDRLPSALARRAAALRHEARQGSAVDAVVVATAEPGGSAITSDVGDLRALAAHADGVAVQRA